MPATKKITDRNHLGQVFNKLLNQIGQSEEFELPDWLNKEKPTPYIFIRRNIYLTKKVKRRVEDDGIFCSCSSSSPGSSSTVCGSNCHCGMLFSSCSSSCKCGSECNNKPFQQRHVKKMKLIQTEKCGSGIVAEEEIKPGEFIIEYVGEVIDDKTCEERLWKMKHRGETNFYLCEINRDMVIDATHKGNKSRYINHSCNPNTQMQKWIIDGETRIGIFATRGIKKGEHLTYDYQFVQFGADQDCHCGAVGCRRKLGVKPSKPKLASDEAFNLVAYEVAQTLPKEHQNGHIHAGKYGFFSAVFASGAHCLLVVRKAILDHVSPGKSWNNLSQGQICSRNCIGAVIRLSHPMSDRCFGLVRHFDEYSRKHSVMFEDGVTEFIDMSREDWEIVTV